MTGKNKAEGAHSLTLANPGLGAGSLDNFVFGVGFELYLTVQPRCSIVFGGT